MRILIGRLGAFGDSIITTPLVRYLKQQGNEIYYLGSDEAQAILENNTNIDKFILHKKNSIPNDRLGEYFKATQKGYECDKLIDLNESLESNLAFIPAQPQYNYTKKERYELANKNYYEEMFRFSGFPVPVDTRDLLPEVFFTDAEEEEYAVYRKNFIGKKFIIWSLSGSSLHKCYPYTFLVMSRILMDYPDVMFITVGDKKCQILEEVLRHERVVHKSGVWNFRQAMIACKHAALVISPDTGLLHASGCFKTPKIGMLTATTIENITKHFINDKSIESKVDCAPCFRLIYNARVCCNMDMQIGAPFCTAYGLDPEKVIERINDVIGCNSLLSLVRG